MHVGLDVIYLCVPRAYNSAGHTVVTQYMSLVLQEFNGKNSPIVQSPNSQAWG